MGGCNAPVCETHSVRLRCLMLLWHKMDTRFEHESSRMLFIWRNFLLFLVRKKKQNNQRQFWFVHLLAGDICTVCFLKSYFKTCHPPLTLRIWGFLPGQILRVMQSLTLIDQPALRSNPVDESMNDSYLIKTVKATINTSLGKPSIVMGLTSL